MPKFVVGPEKAYRLGRFYGEGEIIDLADGEKPSATWTPYKPKAKQAPLVLEPVEAEEPAEKPKRGKRPSDESVL